MFAPAVLGIYGRAADSDHLAGALVLTIAVISMAEVFRAGRFLNVVLGAWIATAPWVLAGFTSNTRWSGLAAGLAVILLSLRRGGIRDRYAGWDRWVAWPGTSDKNRRKRSNEQASSRKHCGNRHTCLHRSFGSSGSTGAGGSTCRILPVDPSQPGGGFDRWSVSVGPEDRDGGTAPRSGQRREKSLAGQLGQGRRGDAPCSRRTTRHGIRTRSSISFCSALRCSTANAKPGSTSGRCPR